MRRWPWFVLAVGALVTALVLYPWTEGSLGPQSEGASSASDREGARPFPLATVLLMIAAGVCVVVGFRPQSAAVQRALADDRRDVHQETRSILAKLRGR